MRRFRHENQNVVSLGAARSDDFGSTNHNFEFVVQLKLFLRLKKRACVAGGNKEGRRRAHPSSGGNLTQRAGTASAATAAAATNPGFCRRSASQQLREADRRCC